MMDPMVHAWARKIDAVTWESLDHTLPAACRLRPFRAQNAVWGLNLGFRVLLDKEFVRRVPQSTPGRPVESKNSLAVLSNNSYIQHDCHCMPGYC